MDIRAKKSGVFLEGLAKEQDEVRKHSEFQVFGADE